MNDEVAGRPIVVFQKRGTASALDTGNIREGRDVGSAAIFDRRVEGQVHLVLENVLAPLRSWEIELSPLVQRGGLSEQEAVARAVRTDLRRYRKALRARLEASDGLPLYEDRFPAPGGMSSRVAPLGKCSDYYLSKEPQGDRAVTLATLSLEDPSAELQAVVVAGAGSTVYASANHLYLASDPIGWWWWQEPQKQTLIHKFALGATPRYLASGKVAGAVINRYALSEVGGAAGEVLRIATTQFTPAGPINRLFTLTQAEDKKGPTERLEVLAALEGLGHPGEEIAAVRYDGDRAYVVTFENTDPLYTLDLADPKAPKIAGALEVPGFSTYLHPFDDGYLLAIGENTEQGGADLSLFDVRDPAAPRLVDREWLGEDSWSEEALHEPKSFTYFAPLRQLAVPKVIAEYEGSLGASSYLASAVFDVDAVTGLTPVAEVYQLAAMWEADKADWAGYPPAGLRTLYIGQQNNYALFSLSRFGMKFVDAQRWSLYGEAAFGEDSIELYLND